MILLNTDLYWLKNTIKYKFHVKSNKTSFIQIFMSFKIAYVTTRIIDLLGQH